MPHSSMSSVDMSHPSVSVYVLDLVICPCSRIPLLSGLYKLTSQDRLAVSGLHFTPTMVTVFCSLCISSLWACSLFLLPFLGDHCILLFFGGENDICSCTVVKKGYFGVASSVTPPGLCLLTLLQLQGVTEGSAV